MTTFKRKDRVRQTDLHVGLKKGLDRAYRPKVVKKANQATPTWPESACGVHSCNLQRVRAVGSWHEVMALL